MQGSTVLRDASVSRCICSMCHSTSTQFKDLKGEKQPVGENAERFNRLDKSIVNDSSLPMEKGEKALCVGTIRPDFDSGSHFS